MSGPDRVRDGPAAPPTVAAAAPPRPARLLVMTRDCVYADAALRRLSASQALELVGLMRSVRPFRDRDGPLATLAAFNRLCGPRYTLHLVATSVAIPGLSRWRTLSAWAGRLRVPVHSTRDANDDDSRSFVEACAPDLVLCVDFNHILKTAVLEASPRRRFFNLHPSLLPRHRGHDPVFHGMLAGDGSFGFTVHALAPRVDTGAIAIRREVPVAGLGLAARYVALFAAGAEAFAEAIARHGVEVPTRPQEGEPNANTYPTPDEVRAFLAASHRF